MHLESMSYGGVCCLPLLSIQVDSLLTYLSQKPKPLQYKRRSTTELAIGQLNKVIPPNGTNYLKEKESDRIKKPIGQMWFQHQETPVSDHFLAFHSAIQTNQIHWISTPQSWNRNLNSLKQISDFFRDDNGIQFCLLIIQTNIQLTSYTSCHWR